MKVRLLVGCVAILAGVYVSGCRDNITSLGSAIGGHALLVVQFSNNPEKDSVLLRNVLRTGGAINCGCDGDYVKFLREYDENFDMAAASNKDGQFSIQPAVLNWIASKGWKFQQKFCINLNADNAEYYFVK